MRASCDNGWFTLSLNALVGYLTAIASLGHRMRRVVKLAILMPMVWISLLCGASWAATPQVVLEQPQVSAPYVAFLHELSPAHDVEQLVEAEAEVTEQLHIERAEPDEGIDDRPPVDDAASRALLLAYLHSGLSPPTTANLQSRHALPAPLISARQLATTRARPPPLV